MGFISRKLFPACESMCVCCPALRSRSRQPVERYKKLLAEIFPKSLEGQPNERKIVKLCEYAAKNPFRIPKIAKYLEERCFKELRSEHIKFINIVTEAYCKMLCLCKQQMAYFAISVLNVVSELLNKPKQEALLILGCQTLARFIYSQSDGTYTHNIENFVQKICKFARNKRDGVHQTSVLRVSSLQCLSAMVWYMAEFSYIFDSFDEIVYAILDNYEQDTETENDDERRQQHNWVDEVVRCDGRGAKAGGDTSSSFMIIKPRPEKKDPSLLTREEIENPRVWAQICIQRVVEMAKESTTMRLVLDPMFVYFDSGRHWVPRQGLAVIVLSEMSYLLETSGNHQLVLAAIVRHLDHKNVAHDPQLKSYVVQVAANLARQIRSAAVLADIGSISDLLKHLRKSVQATAESAGEQESNLNALLQNSIEACLHEIVEGIGDVSPLFDTMALALDKLPSASVVARATIGSLMILSHAISLLPASTRLQQVFPEALLDQLLKAMLHPDIEVRVGAHQIFSVLLTPNFKHVRYETRNWRTAVATASDSVAALLEKLRKEKNSANGENYGNNILNGCNERDSAEHDWKQSNTWKNSPNVYTISSILDRNADTSSLAEAEPCIMKFTEDQIAQLLSAFWIQATLPDNMPSNIEAIAHSFVLVLISFQMKNPNDSLLVRFFQLALSLRNLCLDPTNGMLIPAGRRAVFVLSTGMLMFAAKLYQISDLNDSLEKSLPYDVDPFLGIGNDLQVHVKPQADVRNFGSASDNQLAASLLLELQSKIFDDEKSTLNILARSLSRMIKTEVDDITRQLSEPFTPEDAFMFGHQPMLHRDQNQMVSYSKESLSFDEDIPASSTAEDDVTSEVSVADMSRFIPKMPTSPSVSHIISIGQLLESALQVAGHVAGTSVSTSPLPYDTMARQCEALGLGTRKKLSNWLVHENYTSRTSNKLLPPLPANGGLISSKIPNYCSDVSGAAKSVDPCLAMRLPPASPFDNFLKAAGC